MARPNKSGIKFEMSDQQLELLRKLHNAQAVRELTEHPGWPILQTISQEIIARMENEHLDSGRRLSKDEYWIQGAELSGARKFARLLTEIVAHQIASLDQNYVPPEPIDPIDFDGELNAEND